MSVLLHALLALAMLQPADAHRWQLYMNARFGTRLLYPADMFGRGFESDNGDGITLRSADGATLAIFGRWNVDGPAPAQFVRTLERDPGYGRVTYRLIRRDVAVLSGVRGTRIFYARYAFGDRSGALHAFVLEYPAARRARYDPIAARMSASLRWRSVEVR